jgi:flagellar biosynthesis/type III secretory pathway chaperone
MRIGIRTALAIIPPPKERSILLQIVWAEGNTMAQIGYLEDQIERAERLARSVLDRLTTERLQAYAADCRRQLADLRSLNDAA